jgi:hypothetical protein
MILSAHSSKLLSVGVLLAAYEQELEVRHVSPRLYTMGNSGDVGALETDNQLVDLWLAGEPYAS